jgi:hypothetical protein
METLEPSPGEYVVRRPSRRPASAGAWTLVDADSDTWVLRTADTGRAAGEARLPVLRDRDGVAHYPTGEVTVRFAKAPTDAALRAFARTQRVRFMRRNELEPRQVVFVPARRAGEWLPDVVERLGSAPGVASAWPNTASRYQRA